MITEIDLDVSPDKHCLRATCTDATYRWFESVYNIYRVYSVCNRQSTHSSLLCRALERSS